MTEETQTLTIEVTERQLEQTLRAINSREIQLTNDDKRDLSLELTNVWAQMYRSGEEQFNSEDEE